MGGEVDMPVVCCMKTLRNLESVVDFLSKHQVDDREIVSASASEYGGDVQLKASCVYRLGIEQQLKGTGRGHYTGRIDGCVVSTIDAKRYLIEMAGMPG